MLKLMVLYKEKKQQKSNFLLPTTWKKEEDKGSEMSPLAKSVK